MTTLPFPVRPRDKETFESYSGRVLHANICDATHRRSLTNAATPDQSTASKNATWSQLLTELTGRKVSELEKPPAPAHHEDGSSCPQCNTGLEERWMCLLCAHGAQVKQHPHFSNPVCLKHARWVGLHTPVEEQHPVSDEVHAAALTFKRLADRNHIAPYLYAFLLALVAPASTSVGNRAAEAASFLKVVALAAMLASDSFQRNVLDPAITYVTAYARLEHQIRRTIGALDYNISRGLWLHLRPTFAAIRRSITRQEPYERTWAHDQHVRADLARHFAKHTGKLAPFSEYLDVTEDSIASAEQFTADLGASRLVVRGEHTLTRPTLLVCESGHEYIAQEAATTRVPQPQKRRVRHCPTCRNHVLEPGWNDFATTHPELAAELDVKKSGITPRQFRAASREHYWWTCPQGHSYKTRPTNRAFNQTSCPVCMNRKIVPGVNDIATTHPEVLSEWKHLDDTGGPHNYSAGSSRAVRWVCPKGHEYIMSPVDWLSGHRCHTCAHERLRKNGRHLSATHPNLAAEWDYEENKLTPEDIDATFHKKVAWVCASGHHYWQRVDLRARGFPCTRCAKSGVIQGRNDLATTHADLVSEWHPYKNRHTPERVLAGEGEFWWRCLAAGHDYRHTAAHRRELRGCPLCPDHMRILNTTH
ncbi:Probable Zinc-ribbon domain-containing protein [Paramicrobacterium humi]|uniref:Probable Zinc-ribbon domain-containing protein n=1 Tax=Paramicrobacterium humi TaxID=640635 RepID=A0A1H4LS02_9MICO|nr:zinc-ribbon domain-containing protein [Microbacterium humi]SEB73426.1 Probable Zinc-ribbon domain-containing protein [Microbacterium humi]